MPRQPLTIPEALESAVKRDPGALAVIDDGRITTYGELSDDVSVAARALLANGIEPGDRVLTLMPNSKHLITLILAITSVGAVYVPANTRFREHEISDLVRCSTPRLAIVENGFVGREYVSLVRRAHDLAGDPGSALTVVNTGAPSADPCQDWSEFVTEGARVDAHALAARTRSVTTESVSDMLLTSGTSGRARVVAATHGQTTQGFGAWADIIGLGPHDRQLLALPMFQGFGYKAGVIASVIAGACMVPQPTFAPDASVKLIESTGVTVVAGSPTILADILGAHRAAQSMARIRIAVLGTAFVPPPLAEALLDEMSDDVVTGYGMTECCGPISMNHPASAKKTILSTVGVPVDTLEVRIDSTSDSAEGEICVRGYCVMTNYRGEDDTPSPVDSDGWLRTGDIGRFDEDGNLMLVGRKKEMFIVGGFNVYPAEVEAAIERHPAVHQAAVVGIDDGRMGEVGCAYVIPVPGSSVTEAEIIDFCRDSISNYKVPRHVRMLDEFPRNPLGKVIKSRLPEAAVAASRVSTAPQD